MVIRHLKQKDYLQMPWKNGQGTTLQIAIDEREPYRWRVSSATVSGKSEFSKFVGYDRILVLLESGPLLIAHASRPPHSLPAFEPYTFSGDLETSSELVGNARDFNVWTKRGAARGSVSAMGLNSSETVRLPLAANEHFIFCLEGSMSVTWENSGGRHTLNAGETLHIRDCVLPADATAEGAVRFLWTVIHLSDNFPNQG